ncbi:MAG TPA: amino acid adenylation domain-containing protein, partial [Longimicrobiaceae bacterium]
DFRLPAETSHALRALARSEGATAFMALLAAWQLLLARYAGAEDVSVGTPVAGRTRTELEPLIGFFVNTLVLRTDVSGEPTFRGLLARVRETTLGAFGHQEVPFEKLVEELAPERSLSHTPLFQAVFTLRSESPGEPRLGELRAELFGDGGGTTAKFDLTLGMEEGEEGLGGALEYRTDLWDGATIERMAGHFRRLLEGVAAGPDRRLSDLPLFGDAERLSILTRWGVSGAAPVDGRCVHELFAEQAARTPGAVALVFEGRVLTYGELDRGANGLAHRLAARGVGPEVKVGLFVERSLEMVVGLLAVLKAGGAYLVVDPEYPAERIAFMLADARVPVLLTQEPLLRRLPETGAEVVPLDGVLEAPLADGRPPSAAVTPEHLAYVIYTSGSTGTPKGTEVPHRAIPGFFRGSDYVRFDPDQVVLQHSSTSWDALTLELWPALLTGGRCVLFAGKSTELGVMEETVRREGVTTLWLSSALFNTVVDTRPGVLEGVEQVMIGGETASVPHVRWALGAHPGLRLVNGYGPSECTVFATCHVVGGEAAEASVPIGRPVGDRRVYVLDASLNPVPAGVPGEVFVGGPAVARGYLGRPELTAERFVPDPFGLAGSRMYRVMDRVRWRADGVLEYFGRTDLQVKVRGFRIEPGEVEAALLRHTAVREAAVVARDGSLVGYVVGTATAGELREWLGRRLPEHMVPSAVVVLDAFPLSPNGKIDRGALPAPEASSAGAYVAPRTPAEEVLAGIWAEVLGVERVGAEDDFFALGGHSLLATRVVSRVREAFGVELPLRALFEAPTVAALVERVGAGAATQAPPLVPVPRDGSPLPLSFAQQRLWFIDRLQPGSSAYNMPFPLRVRGGLEVRALERALTEIVRRHESLRTGIVVQDGEPVQRVDPARPVRLPTVDLGGIDSPRELERLAAEEAARPFDLASGRPLRATVVRLGEEDGAVLFTMHHVASDGWSIGVFVREVSALYEGARLPELPVQYADYAVWQR